MADSIKISTQVLVDTAEKVRNCNKNMDERLADINKAMNDLEATWKSQGANSIREAMNAMKPRFEQYKNVVESYAKFLVSTAQSYETTESTVNTNANQFK